MAGDLSPPAAFTTGDFERILGKLPDDSEEMRYEIPLALSNASIYAGIAPDGTATSAASWKVARIYHDANGNPSRMRIKQGALIAWDDRAVGANWP